MREGRPIVSRRRVIAGTGALGVLAAAELSVPRDASGEREPYFLSVQDALRRAGIAAPTIVIDKARLDRNLATLVSHLPGGMAYRAVAKSLPSLPLLRRVRERTGTDRLMTFNLPMLTDIARSMPDANQLLGKPLPIDAFRQFLETSGAYAAARITWLVDTPERAAQYGAVATAAGVSVPVAVEIDVGLHRGGVVPGPDLAAVLGHLTGSPLRFAGLMGYEPHLAKIPSAFGWQGRAQRHAWATYEAAKRQALDALGASALDAAVLNAAGSPTFRLYGDTRLVNEVSVGSVLVKPSDFDTDLLANYQPAAFIAAPVLKVTGELRLPALESLGPLLRTLDPNAARGLYIYGGHWLADPVDPPGLQYSGTFGRSSNQELLTGGARLDIQSDDFVFLRPTQSEVVLLQFGDIAIYDGDARAGEIAERWSVFPASA